MQQIMFYTLRKHVEDMCQLKKNWNKLLLGVLEENIWGNLHSKLAYLHHRHKRRKQKIREEKKRKKNCLYIRLTCLWLTKSAIEIVIQNWISSTVTYRGCVMGKLATRTICLAMQFSESIRYHILAWIRSLINLRRVVKLF